MSNINIEVICERHYNIIQELDLNDYEKNDFFKFKNILNQFLNSSYLLNEYLNLVINFIDNSEFKVNFESLKSLEVDNINVDIVFLFFIFYIKYIKLKKLDNFIIFFEKINEDFLKKSYSREFIEKFFSIFFNIYIDIINDENNQRNNNELPMEFFLIKDIILFEKYMLINFSNDKDDNLKKNLEEIYFKNTIVFLYRRLHFQTIYNIEVEIEQKTFNLKN